MNLNEYNQLLDSYRKMEKENQKLRKVLSLENMSSLEILVRDCMKYNREQFRRVAIEFQLTDYDSKNAEKVNILLEFLENLCLELRSITGVGDYKCKCK